MASLELFRNFLRMSANDLVREALEGGFVAWHADCSAAQKRPTSIHASHPMAIDSV
jgi:hypothetical protein